jgi:hypothetical protein
VKDIYIHQLNLEPYQILVGDYFKKCVVLHLCGNKCKKKSYFENKSLPYERVRDFTIGHGFIFPFHFFIMFFET